MIRRSSRQHEVMGIRRALRDRAPQITIRIENVEVPVEGAGEAVRGDGSADGSSDGKKHRCCELFQDGPVVRAALAIPVQIEHHASGLDPAKKRSLTQHGSAQPDLDLRSFLSHISLVATDARFFRQAPVAKAHATLARRRNRQRVGPRHVCASRDKRQRDVVQIRLLRDEGGPCGWLIAVLGHS